MRVATVGSVKSNGSAFWPKAVNGQDAPVQPDPITNVPMCKDCWDGNHTKDGCKVYGCKCRYYQGKNKGLSRPHAPREGCEEVQPLPDVGTFLV